MSQLIVTLSLPGSSPAELAYALVSSSGVITSHGISATALLPQADVATLIVPAQAISWHMVALPKLQRGSAAQKQAMLAGVLEEQLLDEPSELHLVACPAVALDGKTWVAAVSKAWLQEAVAMLQAARIPLTRIVPQVFPSETTQLHVSGTPEAATLTFVDAQGVFCAPLAQAGLLPALAENLEISAEPAVATLAEQTLGRRVNVLQAGQWAHQSVQAAQTLGVDLAQGDLAVAGGGRAWQIFTAGLSDLLAAPAWAPLRWGVVLLLLINVMGLNAWAWKQSADVKAKRNQMNQILTQSFPNVKVVVDAPLQMQRELTNLRQAQGQLSGRDFESIYGRFAGVANLNSAPSAIDFIANEVRIAGSGLSASQLDALVPRLQYAGLAVRSDAQALMVSHRDSLAAPVVTAGGKP